MKSATRKLPKPEAVRDAQVVPGVALRCVQAQDGGGTNPKHRTENYWGCKSTSSKK